MAEKLTEVELEGVKLDETKPRSLAKDTSDSEWKEEDVETAKGAVHVAIQGNRSKHALFTYHDIGLNSHTCFQGFFNYDDMQPILRHFCVYHINAPGQHEGALPLPQGYRYPNMDELAEQLLPVAQWFGVKTFIGFGVGAGANVLSRFALTHPEKIDGLCLINSTSCKAGWTEWGYQKMNSLWLKSGTMSAAVEDYLLWHWFGKETRSTNHDLVAIYADYIKKINPQNLSHFIDTFIKRSDLGIVRETSALKKNSVRNFRCPVMLVAGSSSAHLDDTVSMNGRLDPSDSTWMKFECGGMVLEEAPDKLCDAFRLFLQGMGYIPNERKSTHGQVPSLSKLNLVQSRSSVCSNANLLEHTAQREQPRASVTQSVGPAYC